MYTNLFSYHSVTVLFGIYAFLILVFSSDVNNIKKAKNVKITFS